MVRQFGIFIFTLLGLPTLGIASITASLTFAGDAFSDSTEINPLDHPGLPADITTAGDARSYVLQAAANHVVSALGITYAGETINIAARFQLLGDVVATAFPTEFVDGSTFRNGMPGIQYPIPLANHIAGAEVFSGTHVESLFNSNASFSFSTTDPPGTGEESLFATAAHEFMHGLGFYSGVARNGSYHFDAPTIFDSFIQAGGLDINTMNQSDRGSAMISNDLFLVGIETPLLAPLRFERGSSGSHWDRESGILLMLPEAPAFGPEPLSLTGTDVAAMELIGWGDAIGGTLPEPASFVNCIWGVIVFVQLRDGYRRRGRK